MTEEREARKRRGRAAGERTRQEILAAARRIATAEGLEALTIGRLAKEIGMSKAGLFGHFGSKEALQVATVGAAYEVFREEVQQPAMEAPPGNARLAAFFRHYAAHVIRHADHGGCFFTAASTEFDDRPGPVRERIAERMRERDALVLSALREAVEQGELPSDADIEQICFEAVAIATGTNALFQLTRDPALFDRARRALLLLASAHGAGGTGPDGS